MNILFIGCVQGSYKLLENLIANNKKIVGIITKRSSKFNSDFCDLSPLAIQHNIPHLYVKNINEDASIDFIKSCKADVGFCFGWSELIKESVINSFPIGIVGFHPAALPNNRGRHPSIWALILGLKETASSFFLMNSAADEGDIISQKFLTIDYADDAQTLSDKIIEIAKVQEIELANALENGSIQKIKQNKNDGNSWRKRGYLDGQIDWRMTSYAIYNLVRGLTHPYVGAHFIFQNKEYKVWKVKEEKIIGLQNIEPGKILKVLGNEIIVKTGENAIKLLEYDHVDLSEGDYII